MRDKGGGMRDEFRRHLPLLHSPFPIPHSPSLIPHPSPDRMRARNEAYDVVAYCAPKVVPVAQLDQSNSLLSCGSQVRILPGTPIGSTTWSERILVLFSQVPLRVPLETA